MERPWFRHWCPRRTLRVDTWTSASKKLRELFDGVTAPIRVYFRIATSRFRHNTSKSYMARYTLGLFAIAILVVLEFVVAQFSLQAQVENQKLARLIELQHFDMGRLTRAALAVELSSPGEFRPQLNSLIEIAEHIHNRHDAIRRAIVSKPRFDRIRFAGTYKQLQSSFDKMEIRSHSQLRQNAKRRSQGKLRSSIESIHQQAEDYREKLRFAIDDVESISESTSRNATRAEIFLCVLILIVLYLEGRYIFRPSIRSMEAALKTRSDFMSRMSHEIRNPMNSIIGMSDALSETPLNDLQKRYLSLMSKSSQTLLELLNNLLDFSAVETGKITLEKIEFSLYSILERVIDISAVRAHGKNLKIFIDIDPAVPMNMIGDPTRLHQVLANLLSNAIKFTAAGQVRLSVKAEASIGLQQFLTFGVTDTGVGIESENLQKIFDSFVQAETSTRREYGGSGLGLTISRELVNLMGGEIKVTSEIGRGSQFSFSIPIIKAADGETLYDRLKLHDLRWLKVLCIGSGGSCKQLANIVRMCGGSVETRIDEFDFEQENSIVAIEADEEATLLQILQLLPESARTTSRVIGLISTSVPPARMLSFMNYGVTEFLVEPLKPIDLVRSLTHKPDELEVQPQQETLDMGGQRKRVLIADDSQENRDLMRVHLRKENFEMIFANDGSQAIKLFQAMQPDLVLMDLQMPGMNGRDAALVIRQWERATGRKQIPLVAVTGDTRREIREQLLAAGYNAFLDKPFRKAELIALTHSLLKTRVAPQEPIMNL